MRIFLLQARDAARFGWGPGLAALALIGLVIGRTHGFTGGWMWTLLALLIVGIIRMAVQSRGPLSDTEATRLPLDSNDEASNGGWQ